MDNISQAIPTFTSNSLARRQLLQTIPADISIFNGNMFNLDTLKALEKELRMYKEMSEKNLANCDRVQEQVDHLYKKKKEQDKTRNKLIKKQDSYSEAGDGLSGATWSSKATVSLPGSSSRPGANSLLPPQGTIPVSMNSSKLASRTAPNTIRDGSVVPGKSKSSKKRKRDENDEHLGGTGKPHKDHKSKKARHHDSHLDKDGIIGHRRAVDFSEPSRGGVPPRPTRQPLPPSISLDPARVDDDMSDRKPPPTQVTINAYWNLMEPWLRPIREEDISFLEYNAPDEDLFDVPPLGQHYTEAWEDNYRWVHGLPPIDRSGAGPSRLQNPYAAFTVPASATVPPSATTLNSAVPPPTPVTAVNAGARWDPATLGDADAVREDYGSGPLTEHLFSALLPVPRAEDPLPPLYSEDHHGLGMGRATGQGTVGDLEDRLMEECRSLGILLDQKEPDYLHPEDDQISAELRICQRLLKEQIKVNNMRKKRLLEIAKVRIAYCEYESIKEGMENNIAAAFSRIGKSGAIKTPKKNKKTKDRVASSLVVDPGNGGPAGISGLGIFAMDGTVEVPEDITEMLHSLEAWKEHVGNAFEQKQVEQPGLVWGLPPTSIYDGLDKDIESTELEEDSEKQKVNAQLVAPHSPSLGGLVPNLHVNIAPGGHLTNGDVMVLE